MQSENTSDWTELLDSFEPPVLLVSTVVGRGMYHLGEALRERFRDPGRVHHISIEEMLPAGAVAEDLKRYKFISSRLTPLLYLIYKCPVFYYRKFVREKWIQASNLSVLDERITRPGFRTVVCVSHRAAFWVSSLKRKKNLDFKLWDLLGEYGNNYGYRYLFWEAMDGFLSPLDRSALRIRFPEHVRFVKIPLPARKAYEDLSGVKGDRRKVLLVCGYWGQGALLRILQGLLRAEPELTVHAVCGENAGLFQRIRRFADSRPEVKVHGVVDSLAPIMEACGSIITKPGISTLLEAHAARRKIFLLKGMPVAEDNNARYAVEHFGATWYTPRRFQNWCKR